MKSWMGATMLGIVAGTMSEAADDVPADEPIMLRGVGPREVRLDAIQESLASIKHVSRLHVRRIIPKPPKTGKERRKEKRRNPATAPVYIRFTLPDEVKIDVYNSIMKEIRRTLKSMRINLAN
jgi:hypothetical protein